MDDLSQLLTGQSSKIVSKMAEDKIASIARSVARQCQLYLLSHPGLRKENFVKDKMFKRLAVQPVGKKGYTALYERPGADGIWRTWAHTNPKIIGINMKKLKKPLGRSFPGFWRVYIGVKKGKESKGYYTWQDKDKTFRDKFMVCTPIEGTRFVVAATTYLDEFTKPVKRLQASSAEMTQQTRLTVWGILGATLLLVGLIVSLFGNRLAGRITSLTEVADRISVGELDAVIDINSKDEIGDLAEAITRMQDSVRLSIERLRHR
jgi:HAMP domain-containing protein